MSRRMTLVAALVAASVASPLFVESGFSRTPDVVASGFRRTPDLVASGFPGHRSAERESGSRTLLSAQRGAAAPPATPRAAAPFDLTGTWVSLVTNEWRWRMLTPPKGEYDVIPLNAAARKIADGWDPAKDEAEGQQCRSYGAAVIMQVPGRLRIAWADDNSLRVETDAGQQTRVFRFGNVAAPAGEPTWQGHSIAQWQPARGQAREVNVDPRPMRTGTLKVVTTGMRPGYLRKNGVPYSAAATVTEYFTPFTDARGNDYFNVQVIVEDPQYLADVYVRSMQFRKEPDGSKWNPQPCTSR